MGSAERPVTRDFGVKKIFLNLIKGEQDVTIKQLQAMVDECGREIFSVHLVPECGGEAIEIIPGDENEVNIRSLLGLLGIGCPHAMYLYDKQEELLISTDPDLK